MKTVFAAAAALTATAILTGPVAAASPMAPLAPPECQSYQFSGFGNVVEDPGPTLFTGWSPDGRSGSVNTRDAFSSFNRPEVSIPEGVSRNGTLNGGVDGRHVHFTVTWEDGGALTGTTDDFTGQVYSATDVRGDYRRGVDGQGQKWHWQGEVKCIDAAASANASPTHATVVADTDIYDKPDGNGKKIGTLYVGEEHPLMEPCHDDWCRLGAIELGGYEGLPNGTAWVYSKGYLTFS